MLTFGDFFDINKITGGNWSFLRVFNFHSTYKAIFHDKTRFFEFGFDNLICITVWRRRRQQQQQQQDEQSQPPQLQLHGQHPPP